MTAFGFDDYSLEVDGVGTVNFELLNVGEEWIDNSTPTAELLALDGGHSIATSLLVAEALAADWVDNFWVPGLDNPDLDPVIGEGTESTGFGARSRYEAFLFGGNFGNSFRDLGQQKELSGAVRGDVERDSMFGDSGPDVLELGPLRSTNLAARDFIAFEVVSSNTPPVAVDDVFTVGFSGRLNASYGDGFINDLALNDTDDGTIDADSFTVVSGPSNGELVVPGDGRVIYFPDTGFSGADSFTYTVEDDQGAVSNEATVTLNVEEAPIVSLVDPINGPGSTGFEIDEGSQNANGFITFQANTTNTNASFSLRYQLSGTTTPRFDYSGGSSDVQVANFDAFDDSSPFNVFRVRPLDDNNVEGNETVVLTLLPSLDGSYELGDVTTQTITILDDDVPPNTSPETTPAFLSGDEDTTITGDLNDFVTDPDGDPLEFQFDGEPADIGVVVNPDGTFTITPDANFNGTSEFSYQVTDTPGFADAIAGQVIVEINPVNDAPVAADDTATTDFETAVTIDVLANDSDPDGDTFTLLGVNAGGNGSTEIVNGAVVYTPIAGFSGVDTFTYATFDGALESNFATVTVTVGEAPEPALNVIESNRFNVRGTGEADYIIGGNRLQNIRGRGGDDILNGGRGPDNYWGGGGADTFVLDNGPAADWIFDWRPNQGDQIALQGGLTFEDLSFSLGRVNPGGQRDTIINADGQGRIGVIINRNVTGSLTADDFTAFVDPLA